MIEKTARLKELVFENSRYLSSNDSFQYLPLKEEEILAFEQRHMITLPQDYRDFLLHVGNGGLGPGTGILPLQFHKTHTHLRLPWVDPVAFNKLFQYNEQVNFDAFNEQIDKIFKKKDSEEFSLYHSADNGLLCIGDAGGGTYYGLVVNGKNQGQIWVNALVSDDGFVWRANSFAEWYEKWLDEKIQQIQKNNRVLEKQFSLNVTTIFMPSNLQELHAFVQNFEKAKDRQPVKDLFNRLLVGKKQQPLDILQACIAYALHHQEFVDHELALQLVKKVSENPREDMLKTWLCQEGTALAGLGKVQQAIACFEKARKYEDEEYCQGELDDKYTMHLSLCHLKRGQSEQALLAMVFDDEICDMDTVVSLLHECYYMYKNYEVAIKWGQLILDWELFQENEESEEYLPDIYLIMISSHARLKNDKQVHLFIDTLKQIKPSIEMVPYENIAKELIKAKCYSIALKCLESYASFPRAQENLQGLNNLKGCCYSELGNYKEAVTCFQESFRIHHWVVPYANLIRCYIRLEKYEKARQIFDEIVAFDPYYSWSYYQFALYYIKSQEEHKALEFLRKAVSLGFDKNEILINPDYCHLAEKVD
ncbi:SMI1/KNR4 family protein [Flagellimonas sp. S3867]|uniref:SMI1/KNR4 family protein n=1 Tax=Flagellimonas sp. S3867 TaxID=2768063 RepID=UPI0016863196|nr:SMI1/KNR4 family protein [Flagellimonas sp. S3867]